MRNPETSLRKARNNPEKLRKNKNPAASSGDWAEEPHVGIRRSNHYTVWYFKLCQQKDNIRVDSRSLDSKGSCKYLPGKCLKVDKRSKFLHNKEMEKFNLNEILRQNRPLCYLLNEI